LAFFAVGTFVLRESWGTKSCKFFIHHMKKLYFLTFLYFCALTALAQGPQPPANTGDGSISGVVLDSTTNKPVEYATVALMSGNSDKPVNGAVCDEKGRFDIRKVAPGNYRVVISFIGYSTKTINVTVPAHNNEVNIGSIKISDSSSILKEITVEAQKPLIEERVDRTIYNADNDATAKGGDASDVLRRVPMLTVDMDGNVSLRGNQNIQVLINNKPSTIVAQNVSDALKQIPADQIKSVEVITSPSARYDAEGSAGIINIITKKNNLEGLTLNIDAGVGLRGSNLGLNGNYRRGKMGFSLGGWGRANYNVTGETYNETVIPGIERQVQTANTLNRGLFGNYTLGWDYDINEKNFITSSVRFGVRNHNRFQDDFLTEKTDLINGTTINSLSEIENKDEANSVDASLTYTHLYEKQGRELSFQGQYSRNNNNSYFINELISGNGVTIENENDSYNQEITIQADYVTPIGTNQILEIGGKDIMRKVFSDVVGGNIRASNLNYEQNVLAGYLSYTLSLNSGYSFKAGSRYEYTTIDAYTQDPDEGRTNVDIPSYGVIVPSLNVSKKFKNGKTVKLSYNRRIQRPSIRYLNPNQQNQNNNNFTIGNPYLDPEYTNNYELGYSTFIKGTSLNFTLFARNTNDAIQSLRDAVPSTTPGDPTQAIRTTYANIGSESAYGSSVFASVNIGKLMLNGGGDVYYAVLDNNSPNEQYRASNEGWVISGRLFGSYDLGKGWAAQFFGFGRGRNVQLQGYQGNFRMYSVGFRKEFNEKRGSVGLGVENFLQKSLTIKSETISPQVSQYNVNTLDNFSVRLNFSYRIGKMSMDQRPSRRRSINNDDLKDGGDGGGGGMDSGGGMGQQRTGGFGGGGRSGAATPNTKMAKADTAAVVNPVGTWAYTIESPQGGSGKLILTKEGETLGGTISNDRFNKENKLSSVTLNGNELSFSYEVSVGGNTMMISVKGTINGNDFNGNMTVGQFGSFPMNAKRSE
jgi:outer membrane receptor for ferrienterochelin and colicin